MNKDECLICSLLECGILKGDRVVANQTSNREVAGSDLRFWAFIGNSSIIEL